MVDIVTLFAIFCEVGLLMGNVTVVVDATDGSCLCLKRLLRQNEGDNDLTGKDSRENQR